MRAEVDDGGFDSPMVFLEAPMASTGDWLLSLGCDAERGLAGAARAL
jgi:hypothetical protein